MDDMRNTSAPLYGKAEPATTKTTMSVREMRQLLGLGKTDSYWLLHKNLFEVILINDKRRIVISSFEKWYANQVKYHKVNGSPPGEELCKRSYSVPDAAEILKVKPETIYTLIRQGKLKTETADFCMRIPKEDFERWYRSQSRYRTAADRERDRVAAEQTHLGDDEERGDQTVNALRAGERLQNQCLTELGGVLCEQTARRLADHADALCRADAGEDDREPCAEQRQVVAGEPGIEKINESHDVCLLWFLYFLFF